MNILTKNILKAGAITLVILIPLVSGLFYYDYKSFLSQPLKVGVNGESLHVKPGMSLYKISRILKKRGIITKPRYFIWHAKFSKGAHKIHVGEYILKPGITSYQLMTMLTSGDVKNYSVSIIPGRTFKQMMLVIHKNRALTHKLKGLTPTEIMTRIGLPGVHPEGRFFPDKYNFPKGMSDIDFLKRAYKAMDRFLQEQWAKRQPGIPIKSVYEALILASVVERETGVPSERPRIAGVFTRRLIKRMKLQSDPTVIYGMGDKYKGNIRRKDLRKPTPYNTYTIPALPITPIAMPSGDAIKAVLHPAKGKSLYFVAKGNGAHYFSATLREHNRAVREYQIRNRKKNYSSRHKPKP